MRHPLGLRRSVLVEHAREVAVVAASVAAVHHLHGAGSGHVAEQQLVRQPPEELGQHHLVLQRGQVRRHRGRDEVLLEVRVEVRLEQVPEGLRGGRRAGKRDAHADASPCERAGASSRAWFRRAPDLLTQCSEVHSSGVKFKFCEQRHARKFILILGLPISPLMHIKMQKFVLIKYNLKFSLIKEPLKETLKESILTMKYQFLPSVRYKLLIVYPLFNFDIHPFHYPLNL